MEKEPAHGRTAARQAPNLLQPRPTVRQAAP